jgi:hypothetical protein
MKKLSLFLFLPVLCLFLSCSKDADGVSASAYFKCKIDGKAYSISGVGAYATVFSATKNNIYGTEAADTKITNPRTMYLSLDNTLGVGTNPITVKSVCLFEDIDKTAYNSNFNNTLTEKGTITITEKTATNMKGTFSFQAFSFTNPVKKIVVTEGEFSVFFR